MSNSRMKTDTGRSEGDAEQLGSCSSMGRDAENRRTSIIV